jgi:hypothetical protein
MFGLIPLSYIVIYTLKHRPKVLVLIIILLMFLNIPAQYGSDSYRVATTPQLNGAEFITGEIPNNSSIVNTLGLYLRFFDPLKHVWQSSVGDFPFSKYPNATEVHDDISTRNYLVDSREQSNYYSLYLGSDPLRQIDLNIYNRLYDNSNYRIFTPHPIK